LIGLIGWCHEYTHFDSVLLVGPFGCLVVALMGRPKRPKVAKGNAPAELATTAPEGLDFGDELAQMDKK
jgi:hypothetical protein